MPAETFKEFPNCLLFLLLNSVFPIDLNFKCTATNALKSKVHTLIRILTFSVCYSYDFRLFNIFHRETIF